MNDDPAILRMRNVQRRINELAVGHTADALMVAGFVTQTSVLLEIAEVLKRMELLLLAIREELRHDAR